MLQFRYMAYKSREDARAYARKHYQEYKQQYRDQNYRRRRDLRDLYQEAKNKTCKHCHQSYPNYVMDFDHRPEETKLV